MSKSSNSSQVLKLRAQIAALEEEKRILSEKLLDARRPISLPSGFYLEQDNNDNLIIHVPAQRSYNPITLPKDPILAFRIIQDIFLNETAKYAHVFLPGASFLEKDGTFTNAERRISRVRKVMAPLGIYADWEATQLLSNALGYPMAYKHPSEIMDEIARTTPTFKGVSYEALDRLGSIQWPCNDQAPEGTPTMHIGHFVIGKGKFMITEFHATEERTGPRFPLILTTGRILSQYNVGAQTRRTPNSIWHEEDVLEIHPFDAELRGIRDGDLVALESRSGDIAIKAKISERMQPGVVYTTFHHAKTGANVITTDYSDWATNCPEYKVTAVQVRKTNRLSDWQERFAEEDVSLTRIHHVDAAE